MDKETKQNVSIELKLDKMLEKMINDRNSLSDSENILYIGFFASKTSYITFIFDPQLMQKLFV